MGSRIRKRVLPADFPMGACDLSLQAGHMAHTTDSSGAITGRAAAAKSTYAMGRRRSHRTQEAHPNRRKTQSIRIFEGNRRTASLSHPTHGGTSQIHAQTSRIPPSNPYTGSSGFCGSSPTRHKSRGLQTKILGRLPKSDSSKTKPTHQTRRKIHSESYVKHRGRGITLKIFCSARFGAAQKIFKGV